MTHFDNEGESHLFFLFLSCKHEDGNEAVTIFWKATATATRNTTIGF